MDSRETILKIGKITSLEKINPSLRITQLAIPAHWLLYQLGNIEALSSEKERITEHREPIDSYNENRNDAKLSNSNSEV